MSSVLSRMREEIPPAQPRRNYVRATADQMADGGVGGWCVGGAGQGRAGQYGIVWCGVIWYGGVG